MIHLTHCTINQIVLLGRFDIYGATLLPLSTGPPRSSSLRDSSSLNAWFLWRRPGVKPQMGLSTGRATSTSWVISANRITSCTNRARLVKSNFMKNNIIKSKSEGWTYQSFLIVVSLGIDTNDHSDFSLSIKVVFKQMGYFRVSVGNHLKRKLTSLAWIKGKYNDSLQFQFGNILCLCHTSDSLEVSRCTSSDSEEFG